MTQNFRDFRRLTVEFHGKGLPHAGILFLPRGALTRRLTGRIVAALAVHARQNPAGVSAYSESYLAV